jgi:hypothetical protein
VPAAVLRLRLHPVVLPGHPVVVTADPPAASTAAAVSYRTCRSKADLKAVVVALNNLERRRIRGLSQGALSVNRCRIRMAV